MFKMVDDEQMSAEVKSALAEMVLPETLDDIEEYLKPEFPPRHQVQREKEQKDEDEVSGRRIVMDGFGRWREIRPKKYLPKKKLNLEINSRQLPQMKKLFRTGSSAPCRREEHFLSNENQSYTIPGLRSRYHEFHSGLDRSGQSSQYGRSSQPKNQRNSEDNLMYDSLGMTTRSNVFPGIGNVQWKTTTSRTFTKKPVTAVEERKNFFGIQTDDFGAWSAANVLNERMKKAWEEYLASAPKTTANWNPPAHPATQHAMPKPSPPPKPKPKKNPPKTKPKKENIVTEPSPLQELAPPSEPQAPIPYIPVDDANDDDDFWEFYDKPFNKPK